MGHPRRRGGPVEGVVRRDSSGRDRAAGQADLEPVPCAVERGRPRPRRLRPGRGGLGRRRRRRQRHRRRAGHVHLRGPRRRHPGRAGSSRTSSRSCAASPSAAPSPASASSRRRSATGCRTSRCWRWTCSPAPARWSPPRPGEDLFDAFPNSYGSLGYATRLRIRLEKAPAYVDLRHLRFDRPRRPRQDHRDDRRAGRARRRPRRRAGRRGLRAGEAYLTLATWREPTPDGPARRRTTPAWTSTSGRCSSARPTP